MPKIGLFTFNKRFSVDPIYSYDLFTDSVDAGDDLFNEKERLGYIFPNNTKFDNLREYIAEIRLVI